MNFQAIKQQEAAKHFTPGLMTAEEKLFASVEAETRRIIGMVDIGMLERAPINGLLQKVTRNALRALIIWALGVKGGNVFRTANYLGMSRSSLQHFMKETGIVKEGGRYV